MKSAYEGKITYFGSEKDIAKAIKVISKIKGLRRMGEGKARLKIQKVIDEHALKTAILLDGNNVWSKTRILQNLERIMKHGTLYNVHQEKPLILSHYFYQFLHLDCGSIAHYDIHGWVHKYPTVEHLKKFFKKNEWGKRVLDWIPAEYTDAKLIVEEIEQKLFPFQTFLKNKEN